MDKIIESPEKSTAKDKKFQYGNVITISLAHMLHDTFGAFLAPVVPLLITKFGISLTLAGFLSVAQRLPSLINPYIGYLADKIRMRYLIIVSPSITAITMSLLGIAPSYFMVVVLLLIMGIGSAMFHVPSPVMIKKVAGNRQGMGMSFYMVGGEIARTLGPIAILSAIDLWTFEGTFRLIPAALAASLILWLKLRRISIYKDFQRIEKNTSVWTAMKKHAPFFVALSFFLLFTSILRSGLTFFLPKFITDKGESLWMGGLALSTYQFAGAIGTFLSGTISDFLGRRKTLLLATTLTPVFMWMYVQFSDTIMAIPILILLGITAFSNTPILLTIVNNLSVEHPAFINSVYMTISFLIGSSAVMIVGALGDFFGLYAAFKINAVLAIFAIPFIWKLK